MMARERIPGSWKINEDHARINNTGMRGLWTAGL